jgi:hypothetical protein
MAIFRITRKFSKDREDYLDLEKVSNLSNNDLLKTIENKNSKPFEIAASLRESRNRSRKKISKKENKNTIPLTQGNFKTSDSTEFVNSYEIKQDSLLKKNEKGKTVFNK